MLLSTRWGKPSSEIEGLPISEFNRQKLFWERCKWGATDDLLALQHSYTVSVGTGGSSNLDVATIKKLAVFSSAVRRVIVEPATKLRKQFMGLARAIKGVGNGR